jgi:hypothetical protein
VMFLMGSPSGGTKRFPGLPSIYDCPRMEGNYLQAPAVRQALAFRSHKLCRIPGPKAEPGAPGLDCRSGIYP